MLLGQNISSVFHGMECWKSPSFINPGIWDKVANVIGVIIFLNSKFTSSETQLYYVHRPEVLPLQQRVKC